MPLVASDSLIPAATSLALLWWHSASTLTAQRYQDGGGGTMAEKSSGPDKPETE